MRVRPNMTIQNRLNDRKEDKKNKMLEATREFLKRKLNYHLNNNESGCEIVAYYETALNSVNKELEARKNEGKVTSTH